MNYTAVTRKLAKDLKNFLGDKKAIIGISGGIDSSVVAALCCRGVTTKNVFGLLLPYDRLLCLLLSYSPLGEQTVRLCGVLLLVESTDHAGISHSSLL